MMFQKCKNGTSETERTSMEERIKLSYFYGKEAEQFSFYKIPKLLFTDEYFKGLSVEAKVLYGFQKSVISVILIYPLLYLFV